MTAKNDITGDALVSKTSTDAYRDNWDKIFGKKPSPQDTAFAVAFEKALTPDLRTFSVCKAVKELKGTK